MGKLDAEQCRKAAEECRTEAERALIPADRAPPLQPAVKLQKSNHFGMIRLIKHEVIPDCGSFEVRFSDGRQSVYFYFENLPGRRLRPDLVDSETALDQASLA